MPKMFIRVAAAVAAIAGAQCIGGYQAFAAEDPKTPQQEEIDRLKAEAERYKEEANLIKARADRDKARVEALDLPSFEGKTTLSGDKAGVIEANMLAMSALQAAADQIGASAPANGKIVVLAGNELADLNQVLIVEAQMRGIKKQLEDAIGVPPTRISSFSGVSPELIIAAANAAAGLLRSEVTVTGVDLASVSERALANAVAGRLKGRGHLPSALLGRLDEQNPILQDLEELSQLRGKAAAQLSSEAQNSPKAVALTAAIKRFDDFHVKMTSPDEKGGVPIVRAAQLNQLFTGSPHVLRVFVDRAGGTFINTKNLATFLGSDPLRVTGGVIASYTVTAPNTAQVVSSNIYVCRTALNRLRQIHDANWKGAGGTNKALCSSMASRPS